MCFDRAPLHAGAQLRSCMSCRDLGSEAESRSPRSARPRVAGDLYHCPKRSNPRSLGIVLGRRWLALFLAGLIIPLAIPLFAGSSPLHASLYTNHPSRWWTHTDQQPPRSSAMPQWLLFQHLFGSYHAIGKGLSLTFQQWLVMNGITDPGEQAFFMWLYRWNARQAGR